MEINIDSNKKNGYLPCKFLYRLNMRLHLLYVLPVLAGVLAVMPIAIRVRTAFFQLAAWAHLAMTISFWLRPFEGVAWGGALGIDASGLLFLTITSVVYALVSLYVPPWLEREHSASPLPEDRRMRRMLSRRGFISIAPDSILLAAMSCFLGAMTLVQLSQHMALFWIMIEATTLASAPLILYHQTTRSLEALWKYLLLCSVGIAIALLGTFCLAASFPADMADRNSLLLSSLMQAAPALQPAWVKLAVAALLVGYGAKLGLAPMHSWLPDAHSEAPAPASALLSASLLNCAFLGILRVKQIAMAAGLQTFFLPLLLGFGFCSVVVASFFILRQPDYKRLLAYSSIENIGLATFAIGLNAPLATLGACLHLANHSLMKASLFLSAGNLFQTFGTKQIRHLRGLIHSYTFIATLWLIGLLGILGMPPSGLFLSKLIILYSGFQSGHPLLTFLLLLAIIFAVAGIAGAGLRMTYGKELQVRPPNANVDQAAYRTPSLRMKLAPLILILLSVSLCLWPFPALIRLIQGMP